MKQTFVSSFKKALPIIISGLIAAGITFLQTLASQWGQIVPSSPPVETAGILGMTIKGIHTLWKG